MNNYQPTLILTCFFLIIAKILYVRHYKVLKNPNVIYKNKYGFQSNISTLLAILVIVTFCYDNVNEFCYTALFFVDL